MLELIAADTRGLTQTSWLTSHHSFSFGEYHDPKRMGFGSLRVLNEDTVAPSGGFPLHFHSNMEIITIVLEGSLEHKDSLGNHGVIRAGDVQHMTAGSGIKHSEFNASSQESVHFLQIWITPAKHDLPPEYQQQKIPTEHNVLMPIVDIYPQAEFFLGHYDAGISDTVEIEPDMSGYFFLIHGEVKMGDITLKSGDALSIRKTRSLDFTAKESSSCLLIQTNEN